MYIDIVIFIKLASSAKVSLISVLQFLNAPQFLDTTSADVVRSASLAFLTAITPVTKIHASEESQGLYSNELVKNLIGFSCE